MAFKDKTEIQRRTKLKFRDRLEEGKSRVNRFKIDYFNEDTGETWCKLCNAKLRVLKSVRVGSINRKVAVETAAYTEITLRMHDGSAHETCLCKKCAFNLTDDQAELCYLIDVNQWLDEVKKLGPQREKVEPEVLELAARVPTQVLPYSRNDRLNSGGK